MSTTRGGHEKATPRINTRSSKGPQHESSPVMNVKSVKVPEEMELPKMDNVTTQQMLEMLKSLQTTIAKMDNSLDTLNSQVAELRSDMDKHQGLVASVEFVQSQIETTQNEVDQLKVKVASYDYKYDIVAKQLSESRMENEMLKERLLQLEAYGRRENLRFIGIKEDKAESAASLYKKMQDIFVNNLGISHGADFEYQRCHRIGPMGQNKSVNREVIFRFTKFQERELVWSNRRMLKGSNIIIKEDFPPEIEQRRNRLYPIFIAAKTKGMKAVLISDKLIIDSHRYTVDTLDSLPKELQPRSLAEKVTDSAVMFYGKDSQFSNFSFANFTIDGVTYCSSEQYYQYQKAKRVGDNEVATRILETSVPVEQYRLGKTLKFKADQWNNKIAQQIMECGVKAKFEQNKELKNLLISSASKMFIECNKYDPFWGNGLSIHDVHAEERSKWKGENALGNILIRVREGLK